MIYNPRIKELLDQKYEAYAKQDFIALDPISIPKSYNGLQDIEITAFWTAMMSWGQRQTIINKCTELFGFMDNAPYQFILNHNVKDLKPFTKFVHRTFQPTDALYFISFFKEYYADNNSLEDAFMISEETYDTNVQMRLKSFHNLFFNSPYVLSRTKKHVSTPANKSTCKRLNMFLRWMVRTNTEGIDFGLWNRIPIPTLMIPYDVHVERVARNLGLIERKQRDWQAVEELTKVLRVYDPEDPIQYDFALFGMGAIEKYDFFRP